MMTKFLDQAGLVKLWGKIKDADKANSDAIVLKADKSTVDGILTGDKPLVTPTWYATNW